jgi:heme-degrading monooxygenase HmoA
MFARMCWFQSSPERVDDRIAMARQVLPLQGCVGMTLLINRGTGDGASVSYWDSPEALQASEATEDALRTPPAAPDLLVQDVDRVEFLIQEGAVPPRTGSWVRLNDLRGSPAKVDVLAGLLRERIVPVATVQPGFHALIMGTNRQTGRSLVFSVWDTVAAREASGAPFQALRTEVRQLAGIEAVQVGLYESAFTEVKPPAAPLL